MLIRLVMIVLLAALGVSCVAPAALLPGAEASETQRERAGPSVRVVYLVSADRHENPDYTRAIGGAMRQLQSWYGRQLGGPSFTLHDPVVDVVQSDKPARWFYAHPNGERRDDWGYNNALSEVARLRGARLLDPTTVWVIYSDGPGNKGRGGSGVAVLPEDDLLGLVGHHPKQRDPKRWIAGLGHELGHAFGLPHPEDTTRDADALMWTGIYGKFPEPAYLTSRDRLQLQRSPFFWTEPPGQRLQVLRHGRGAFERRRGAGQTYWLERDAAGAVPYTFREVRVQDGVAIAHDRGRGFQVALPLGGGVSQISADGGRTWGSLYPLTPD